MKEKQAKTLFNSSEDKLLQGFAPLAVRVRPQNIDDFVGQAHFAGPGKLLRRMLESASLTSIILYGPPGTGKTTLAHIIANHINAVFEYISAPAAGVKEIRQVLTDAKDRLIASRQKTVFFIDEIHRFNRAQQDVLLDDVENGIVTLIGATTENPFFYVNSPLVSRSTIFTFEPLSPEDIKKIIRRAVQDKCFGYGNLQLIVQDEAINFLADICDGDARRALTALEVAVLSKQKAGRPDSQIVITIDDARDSVQRKSVQYDGSGDTHYDLASALQKSMRGSDPDATVYWLARMIAGGEDVRFIARRIAVCAAEDVGNADPIATVLAASAFQISEFVGLPEAQLALAQAAIYVACAPKSNASSAAIGSAIGDVQNEKTVAVPKHLKDSHYSAAKKMGFGAEYKYPHSFEGGFVVQEYLPGGAKKKYYKPTERGYEKNIRGYLQKLEILIKDSKAKWIERPNGAG